MGNEKKPVGKTKDVGYQVGARMTIPVEQQTVWKFLTTGNGLGIWLGETSVSRLSKGVAFELPDGTSGQVRVFSTSHLRMSWQPSGWQRPSTIQVRAIPKKNKTVVAFHQEHLPGPEERKKRKTFYKEALEAIARKLNG